ncbi:MAG: hypothetical protein AB1633_00815 [Elusimicrobiota bacterium]
MDDELTKSLVTAEESYQHGDYDNTIHNCNKILKLDSGNIKTLLLIADTYRLKADRENNSTFYKFSMEAYKKILSLQPANELAHNSLLKVAMKAGVLDELAMEYAKRIKKLSSELPLDEKVINVYKSSLSKIHTLATFVRDAHIKIPLPGYSPNLLIRILFDFLFLPMSVLLVLISIFDSRFQPMLLNSTVTLLFYIAYRLVLGYKK